MTITVDIFTREQRYLDFLRAQREAADFKATKSDDMGSPERREWDAKYKALTDDIVTARRRFAKIVDEGDLADAIECCFVARSHHEGHYAEEMLDFSGVQSALNAFIPHDYDIYEYLKTKIRNALTLLVNTGRAVEFRVENAPGHKPYGTRADMKVWQTPEFVQGLLIKEEEGRARVASLRTRQSNIVSRFMELGIVPMAGKAVDTLTFDLDSLERILEEWLPGGGE